MSSTTITATASEMAPFRVSLSPLGRFHEERRSRSSEIPKDSGLYGRSEIIGISDEKVSLPQREQLLR